jgi:hypothetical protein
VQLAADSKDAVTNLKLSALTGVTTATLVAPKPDKLPRDGQSGEVAANPVRNTGTVGEFEGLAVNQGHRNSSADATAVLTRSRRTMVDACGSSTVPGSVKRTPEVTSNRVADVRLCRGKKVLATIKCSREKTRIVGEEPGPHIEVEVKPSKRLLKNHCPSTRELW